jgi:hypothetical protein
MLLHEARDLIEVRADVARDRLLGHNLPERRCLGIQSATKHHSARSRSVTMPATPGWALASTAPISLSAMARAAWYAVALGLRTTNRVLRNRSRDMSSPTLMRSINDAWVEYTGS